MLLKSVPHACLGLALLAAALPAQQPSDPKALMLAALKANNLTEPGIKPWHIKASYQLLDEQGQVTDEGTYEEFWAGPAKFKRIFTGRAFTQTDYGSEKGVLRSGASKDASPLLLALRRDLVQPLPGETAIKQFSFSAKTVVSGGLQLTCLSSTSVATTTSPTYCVTAGDPILRISAWPTDSIQVLHNGIQHYQDFGNLAVASDIKIVRAQKTALTAHLESLDALDSANTAIFEPSSDATLLPRRITISSGVAQSLVLEHTAPVQPAIAQAARI